MKPARVSIAAPGGRPTTVVRAPFAVAPDSKRAPKIQNQEVSLKNELITLEEGCVGVGVCVCVCVRVCVLALTVLGVDNKPH